LDSTIDGAADLLTSLFQQFDTNMKGVVAVEDKIFFFK